MSDPEGGRQRRNAPSTDDAGEVVVERLPPEEAFELLGHETRFRILEALNDADDPVAFSTLRERVGVDDPGQFNYHLGKLAGGFVRDTGDGYELAAPGRRVVGAVLSGGYTKALDADPVETDDRCIDCGGRLVVRFRADGVDVACRQCGETVTNTAVPAAVLEGVEPEAVLTTIDRWIKRVHSVADFGFCFNCDGRMTSALRLAGHPAAPDRLGEDDPDAVAVYACDRCGFRWHSFLPSALLLDPAVAGFHHEHGIDVRETPLWRLDWPDVDAIAVETVDPPTAEVEVTLDDETAVFTVDEALNVVEERRR